MGAHVDALLFFIIMLFCLLQKRRLSNSKNKTLTYQQHLHPVPIYLLQKRMAAPPGTSISKLKVKKE
jgi:hypothetical protein